MQSKWKQCLSILTLLVVLIFVNEFMFRLSPSAIFSWLWHNPLPALMNLAFLIAATALLTYLTKRPYLAIWLVTITSLSLGIANANKFSLRSTPLVFEDIFLLKEVWVLLPKLINTKTLVLIVLAVPLVYGSLKLFKKLFGIVKFEDYKKPIHIACLLSVVILTFGQLAYTNDMDAWDAGFIYSLSNSTRPTPKIDDAIVEKAHEKIAPILDQDRWQKAAPKVKPNVLVIMSESFWDVRKLGVEFEHDPLHYFDQLKTESQYGELYVPVFGGGTANTEYEVLTGMSIKNFPYDWHMVYREEIFKPHPSLATAFKTYGYKTVALHPYYPWYYRRNEVYPLLGFDAFISIEELAPTLDESDYQPFISDAVVTNELLKLIEQEEKPVFNYTVTMQNHGPYDDNRYENPIAVRTPLTEASETLLSTYTQGISHSETALRHLIESLRKMDEPTLVLFFGDHLPMLGDDYAVYRETGYIDDESSEALKDDLRMTTVPYVLWANYPIETGEQPLKNASFMSPVLLEQAGLNKPPIYEAIDRLASRAPLFLRDYFMTPQGEAYASTTEAYKEIQAIYAQLQERALYHGTDTPPDN